MFYDFMQRFFSRNITISIYIYIYSDAMILTSKKILRLWLGWEPPHQRQLPAITSMKTEGFDDHWTENSSQSLLAGRYFRQWNTKEVPRGFLAVYVGPELRRFVIPTSYLSMPDFRALMERMADEFGFQQEGGLQIPCEEEDFEEILRKCWTMHQTKIKNKNRKKD